MTIFNHYVDSSAGNDANGGTSWGDAWQSLPYALATCSVGGAGADVVKLNLDGTFTLAGPLTVPLITNGGQLAFVGKTYGVDGNGYRTCGTTINLAGFNYAATARSAVSHEGIHITGIKGGGYGGGPINVGGQGHFMFCKFTNGSESTSGYAFSSINGIVTAFGCDFISTGVTLFFPTGFGGMLPLHLVECLCDNFRQGYGSIIAQRCRFRNATVGSGAAFNHLVLNHCSFFNCFIDPEDNFTTQVLNCVFHRTGDAIDNWARGVMAAWKNAYYVATEDSGLANDIVYYEPPTILTTPPFTDPANNDWTPSSELSSIVGTDGLTLGAVQVASSGGSRPSLYSPFLIGSLQ